MIDKAKLLLKGKASKKSQGIYLFGLLFFCIIFFTISIIIYPNYSIFQESISSLGIPNENPDGYFYWSIGMMILGLLFIPHLLYFYRVLHPTAYKTSIISLILSIIASLGLVGVGFFPEDTIYPHYTCATIAFLGYFSSFCCNLYILNKKIKDQEPWPKKWQVFLLYFQLFGIMFLFISAFIIFGLFYFYGIYWIAPNLPFLEWAVFISNLLYIIGLFLIIPDPS
ncbi:DUF998 domain-containing protein [Candidatus Lokiarchaeum ossiferum]|uniref:DUF998 domain-containing protein n=1 Tax=Candidatus Lokiarchaeum ossiferum TaxID=2951803 RepID=UPI00352DADD5